MTHTLSSYFLHLIQTLFVFSYYYPLLMAYLWSVGAILFYWRYEYKKTQQPTLPSWPKVSIVVPCYNEEDNVRETIKNLLEMNYPDYEIIAVNDGSSDGTQGILDELSINQPKLRVIRNAKNQGKSISLNTAAYLAASEYIIGIDGDALLDHNAIAWFVHHFETNPRVGAVTGNPRIRTRSTLLGRLQVGEFSSLVGLIKRAQQVFYRRIFTASGVITAFRRTALHEVGYWSPDMLTEDMDITWKLQLKNWEIRFEPRALAWILMPETLGGLWKQRLRWAMGGLQTIAKYKGIFLHQRTWGMWPLLLEQMLSVLWACSITVVLGTYLFSAAAFAWAAIAPAGFHPAITPVTDTMTALLPEFSGVIVGTTCLLQMLLSMWLERRYDHRLLHYFVWTIWYPFGFWMVNMLTVVVGIGKMFFRQRGMRARWVSPDRGIQS
jgi:poly-beta-1,6-N-acetyl-D-glucosamine synthase